MENASSKILSIIIPVYNVEKYLNRCLDSIIMQDRDNCEVILVDDGSQDNCPYICDDYARKFSDIKVIHQRNGGLSKARNVGMSIADGEYIMFVDSDDWIERECINRFKKIINSHRPDVIMGKAWVVDNAGDKKNKLNYFINEGYYSIDAFFQFQKNRSMFSACAPFYIVKRSLVINNCLGFKEGILLEDDLWTPILLTKANTIFFDNNYFYNHYIRESSIMHGTGMDRLAKNYFIVCEELDTYFKGIDESKFGALKDHISNMFLQAICMIDDPSKYFKQFPRSFPWKYAFYKRMKLKSILYFISPTVYLFVHKAVKGF